MRLIVLTGLVVVEKIDLALDLARHTSTAGKTVTIIDNVRRLAVDDVPLDTVTLVRLDGDLRDGLLPLLDDVTSDVTLLAVAETVRPDDLFVLLNDLRDHLPGIEVQTLALIDERTCDCFPQLRVLLEDYADVTVNLPVTLDEVVAQLR